MVYQVLEDLRRSWRVVLPNLEQCGLLKVRYNYLEDSCKDESLWKDVTLLKDLNQEDRLDFIQQVLDYFRKQYAIRCEDYCYFFVSRQKSKKQSNSDEPCYQIRLVR